MGAQTRGSPELRGEMHAREAGRGGNSGEGHALADLGLEIIDRSLQSPSRECAHLRSLGHAIRRGEKPCNDGDADAVRIELSERATDSVGIKQCARHRVDRHIPAGNAAQAEHRRCSAGHVAGAFGD